MDTSWFGVTPINPLVAIAFHNTLTMLSTYCSDTLHRLMTVSYSFFWQLQPKKRITAQESLRHPFFADLPTKIFDLPNGQTPADTYILWICLQIMRFGILANYSKVWRYISSCVYNCNWKFYFNWNFMEPWNVVQIYNYSCHLNRSIQHFC